MATQLTLIARLTAKPEQAEALGEGMKALIHPTVQEPGSLGYTLHCGNGDPTVWILYETWASRADLDAHFEQPYHQPAQRTAPDRKETP